jgi:hypothetical protein
MPSASISNFQGLSFFGLTRVLKPRVLVGQLAHLRIDDNDIRKSR